MDYVHHHTHGKRLHPLPPQTINTPPSPYLSVYKIFPLPTHGLPVTSDLKYLPWLPSYPFQLN